MSSQPVRAAWQPMSRRGKGRGGSLGRGGAWGGGPSRNRGWEASLPLLLILPSAPVLAEASVRGLEDRKLWQVGREGATLRCLSEGQPPPSYNWTR